VSSDIYTIKKMFVYSGLPNMVDVCSGVDRSRSLALALAKACLGPLQLFFNRRTSKFLRPAKLLQFNNNTITMPPKTKTAHRANGGKRFEAPKTRNVKLTESDDERDATAGALQPITVPKEPEWEGFGEEDNENSSEISEDEDVDEDEEESEDDIPDKDDEEEALERLVFGDAAGFKEGIKAFSLDPLAAALGEPSEEETDGDGELENLADQDLFFFDSGPTAAPATALTLAQNDEEEEGPKPAWEDSDDDRLVVSLASVPQLRKLREDEDDDMVNGREYVRRLRKQYTRLYPTPDWALKATGKTKRKRTHTTDGESGEESASDMDVDEEDLSTQPLARLMKDADILSRNISTNPAKRRKLQAGTIDIQRLKDVCKSGSVCTLLTLIESFANRLYYSPQ
jgi:U3 small nucleolar RNA-associated protein 18